MIPRDRIRTAFAHRQPDRVPIDFSGHRSSGIAAIAYANLRKHLGLPEESIRVYDPVASKNSDEDHILAQECQAQISHDLWLVVVSCTLPRQQLAKQPSTVCARITRSALRLMGDYRSLVAAVSGCLAIIVVQHSAQPLAALDRSSAT